MRSIKTILLLLVSVFLISKANGQWKPIGNAGFTPEETKTASIAFNPVNGQPVIATEQDSSSTSIIKVYEYSGAQWVQKGLSLAGSNPKVTFSSKQNLYVSYTDNNGQFKLKQFLTKFGFWYTKSTQDQSVVLSEFKLFGDTMYALYHSQTYNQWIIRYFFYNQSNGSLYMNFLRAPNWINLDEPPTMTVTPSGTVCLAYDSNGYIKVFENPNFTINGWKALGDWHSSSVFLGKSPKLVSNTDGKLALVYYRGKTYIRYLENGSWTDPGGTGYGIGFTAIREAAYNPSDSFYYWWAEKIAGGQILVAKHRKDSGYRLLNNISLNNLGTNLSGGINPKTQVPYTSFSDPYKSRKSSVMAYSCDLFPNPSIDQLQSDLEVCKWSDASLTGNGMGRLSWYTGSTNQIPIKQGSSITLNGLTTDTTLYIEDQVCGSASHRIPVEVVINKPSDLSIVQQGDSLKVTNGNYTYQWLDCKQNKAIDYATESYFVPSQSGSYATEITTPLGCSDTTDCITYTSSNLPVDLENRLDISLNNGAIHILSPNLINKLIVRDLSGRELLTNETNSTKAIINYSDWKGILILTVEQGSRINHYKLMVD